MAKGGTGPACDIVPSAGHRGGAGVCGTSDRECHPTTDTNRAWADRVLQGQALVGVAYEI